MGKSCKPFRFQVSLSGKSCKPFRSFRALHRSIKMFGFLSHSSGTGRTNVQSAALGFGNAVAPTQTNEQSSLSQCRIDVAHSNIIFPCLHVCVSYQEVIVAIAFSSSCRVLFGHFRRGESKMCILSISFLFRADPPGPFSIHPRTVKSFGNDPEMSLQCP